MRFFADFCMLSCAVFALAYLVHFTDGPGDVFFIFRTKLIGEGETENFFSKLFDCFWCSSTWSAIIVVGLYWILMGYEFSTFPFVMLGTVGVSGFLYEKIPDG